MKITVAIPCYNLEDRIAACLESVITQDYKDVEILIIDDCSSDNSVEIIKRLIDGHPEREFRFIINETNLGLNKVRNLAIDEAHGEALFFVDGDDTIELETLSLFNRKMEEQNVDVVCGSYRKIDNKGNAYFTKQYIEETIKGHFALSNYIEKNEKKSFCLAVWNNLYRLDFLKFYDIHCAINYMNYEDILFTFKVLLYARGVSFIHKVTYNYCFYSESISNKKVDGNYFPNYFAVTESVFSEKQLFENNHKDQIIPSGVKFMLNYIYLTNGVLKKGLESDVSKIEKKLFLKKLRETYHHNNMNWKEIVGTYNKISYLILVSPCPYTLFRFYYKHLRTIVEVVDCLTKSNKIMSKENR